MQLRMQLRMQLLRGPYLRIPLRIAAYLAVALLAAVWLVAGLSGVARGEVVSVSLVSLATSAGLDAATTATLARMLVGARLTVGLLLVLAIGQALRDALRGGEGDDALLDVALLFSAVGSVAGGVPIIGSGEGVALQSVMGELLLCSLAQGFAAYGRAMRPKDVVERPRPAMVPGRGSNAL